MSISDLKEYIIDFLEKKLIYYIKNFPKIFLTSIINIINRVVYFIRNFSIDNYKTKIDQFIKKPLLPFTLYKMLFKSFIYWLCIAQGLFLIIFLIFDFFTKINTFVDRSVSILNILAITLLLSPKAIWMTMPVAIMFGIIMSLSSLYQSNELIAMFTSGISIFKLVVPLIIFNILLSIFMIFADSFIIIPTFRFRENLYEYYAKPKDSVKDITIKGKNNYFWKVDSYNSTSNNLNSLTVFKVNSNFKIVLFIEASSAVYTKNGWVFKAGVLREWGEDGSLINDVKFYKRIFTELEESPKTFKNVFKKSDYDIDKMTITEAKERINMLKDLGIPYNDELLNYYRKFSFPFTIIIVCLIAIGVSTLSRRNILILALFFSVGLAIIYYIVDKLIITSLASGGFLPPFIGAWISILIFLPISIHLIKKSKT